MNAKEFKRYDRGLIFTIVFLAAAGLLMVLSSSYFMAAVRKSSGLIFFYKQMLWVFLGAVAAWLAAFKIDYRFYRKFIGWGYLIVLVALIAVLIFGPSINGARRWIFLGPISFQPSEFAKLIMIFVMADFIDRRQTRLLKVNVTAPIIYLFPFLIFITLEPDLGSIFLLIFISALMLFYSGLAINKKIIGVIGSIFAILIVQALVLPYRRARLMHYFSGILDMNGVLESSEKTLYQVKMSLFALGSGGPFLGKGPGNSHLKLLYLPEAHTDFIYPIIGEEFGFIGALLIILAFMVLFIKGLLISRNCTDIFGKFLAFGITLFIVVQAIMNIGVSLGIFPTKGLVLPFISSGGTSIIVNMFAAGILINLSKCLKK